ncbi:MAG: hypothetical protein KGS48_13635 [Bacteroidetes bacterium]|nr:hypothetical protein [Bacteroidota bacterium]
MKVSSYFSLLSFLLLLVWSACGPGPDPELGCSSGRDYSKGVFVVNEGGFNGSGSISWYDEASGTTVADVYASENCGAKLGQFVQSISFFNEKAYIVVNGANKIVIVDARTFEYIDTIGGLGFPRYFYPIDDKTACVTQWGVDGLSGSIAVVNLTTRKVIQKTPLPQPEKMYQADPSTLLVANIGGYGLDSTISYIDIKSGGELKRRKFRGAPVGFAALNNKIYVLGKGGYGPAPDYTPYPGWLAAVDGPESYELLNGADDLCASPSGNALYFIAGGIYKYDGSGAPQKIVTQASYALACNPANGYLYCSDPKDFASNGKVLIYKPDGTKVGEFGVGIAPGDIVIRN